MGLVKQEGKGIGRLRRVDKNGRIEEDGRKLNGIKDKASCRKG